jgi:Tfp pilus assembly protein PilF
MMKAKSPAACTVLAVAVVLLVCGAATGEELPAAERRIDDVADMPAQARVVLFSSQQHREQGDPDSAVDELLRFLEEYPDQDHFLLHFHLAASWAQRGDLEEALASYRRSVDRPAGLRHLTAFPKCSISPGISSPFWTNTASSVTTTTAATAV